MKSMKVRLSKAGKWWRSLDQECENATNKAAHDKEFEEIHNDYIVYVFSSCITGQNDSFTDVS